MAEDLEEQIYAMVAPVYIVVGIVSLLSAAAISWVYWSSADLRRHHASTIINIITMCDLLYTLKFFVGAVAWAFGLRDERDSFHLFDDNCMSAVAYGQFTGMAAIAWNACWTWDFLCVLRNPLRNTASQRRWYHLFVWSLCIATTAWVLAANAHEGSDNHTCWVRSDSSLTLVFVAPLFIFMSLALFSLVYAGVRLQSGARESDRDRRRALAQHWLYVTSFVLLWLWPILHRYADLDNGTKEQQLAFAVMDALTVSGQTAVFAMLRLREPGAWAIFKRLLKRSTRRIIAGSCAALCCCCCYHRCVKDPHGDGGSSGGSTSHRRSGNYRPSNASTLSRDTTATDDRPRGDFYEEAEEDEHALLASGGKASPPTSLTRRFFSQMRLFLLTGRTHRTASTSGLLPLPGEAVGRYGYTYAAAAPADRLAAAARIRADFNSRHEVDSFRGSDSDSMPLSPHSPAGGGHGGHSGHRGLEREQSIISPERMSIRRGSVDASADVYAMHQFGGAGGEGSSSSGGGGGGGGSGLAAPLLGGDDSESIRKGREANIPGEKWSKLPVPVAISGSGSGHGGGSLADRALRVSVLRPRSHSIEQEAPTPAAAAAAALAARTASTVSGRQTTVGSNTSTDPFSDGDTTATGSGTATGGGETPSTTSMGSVWDIGANLRAELGMSMLSALCQAVAASGPSLEQLQNPDVVDGSKAGDGSSSSGGAVVLSPSAPEERRSIAAWLKDSSTVQRNVPMLYSVRPLLSVLGGTPAADGTTAAAGTGAPAPAAASTGAGATPTAAAAPTAPVAHGALDVVSFCDRDFVSLRRAAGLSSVEVLSGFDPGLLREGRVKAHFSDGASSSFFCRSADGALVIKTIAASEVEVLLRLLPAFARHLVTNPNTLLTRIYGCYGLRLPSSFGGMSTSRLYFVLMGNVFPIIDPAPNALLFDLKGSTVNRRAKAKKPGASSADLPLQDMEFRDQFPAGVPLVDPEESLRMFTGAGGSGGGGMGLNAPSASPTFGSSSSAASLVSASASAFSVVGTVTGEAAWAAPEPVDMHAGIYRSRELLDQLRRDVTLLASQGLMDYSLLVRIQPLDTSASASASASAPVTRSSHAHTPGGSGNASLAASQAVSREPSELSSSLKVLPHGSIDGVTVVDVTAAASGAGGGGETTAPINIATSGAPRASVNLTAAASPLLQHQHATKLGFAALTLPRALELLAQVSKPPARPVLPDSMSAASRAAVGDAFAQRAAGSVTRWSPLAVSLCAMGTGSGNSHGGGGGAAGGGGGGGGGSHGSGQSQLHPLQSPSALSLSFSQATISPANSVPRSAVSFTGSLGTPSLLRSVSQPGFPTDLTSTAAMEGTEGMLAASLASSHGSHPGGLASLSVAAAAATATVPVAAGPPSQYPSRGLLQIGVVDMLQYFDAGKRMENALKNIRYASLEADVSAVDPHRYAIRFMDFAGKMFDPSSAPPTS